MIAVSRIYSVPEIDRMRDACRSIECGTQFGHSSAPFDLAYRFAEERLRTYMLAGAAPEDVEQAARVQLARFG